MPPCRPQAPSVLTFLALALLSTLLAACTIHSSAFDSQGRGLFTLCEDQGIFPVSAEEAAAVAKQLAPHLQKASSFAEFAFAVDQSLAHASKRKPATVAMSGKNLSITYGKITDSLTHLKSLLPKLDTNPQLLATEFSWFRIGPDFGITGYYEPTLRASRTKTAEFYYPLYSMPKDVQKGKTYHTRHQIDRKGAIAGRGLEIAWVDSEVDAFFLHVQGSGRLLFPDGSTSHILYAGKNNRSYTSLGRVMKEEGLLQAGDVTMPSIRRVLAENPDRQAELLDRNASYVFFREASKGPLGAMGYPLTPWVSIATDPRVLPAGALAVLISPLPDASGNYSRSFHGLVLPQDRGGAIKGNRVDIFFGPDEEAAHLAGHLDARGAVYVLVKK